MTSSPLGQLSSSEAQGRFSVPYVAHHLDPDAVLAGMPLLSAVSLEAMREDPCLLSPFGFVLVLHFLRDLLGLMRAFERVGLNPGKTFLLHKPYMYPNKEAIASGLERQGYRVAPLWLGKQVVDQAVAETEDAGGILVVEDGGHVASIAHRDFPDKLHTFLGSVEQTEKGIRRLGELGGVGMPVYDIARCQWKDRRESDEVARVAVDNIRRLLSNHDLRGKAAVVIGYGRIGARVANRLRNEVGMRTYVWDTNENNRVDAATHGHVVKATLDACLADQSEGKLVVGATGEPSITEPVFRLLPQGTCLVSVSSDQVEIGVQHLRNLAEDPRGVALGEGVTRFRLRESEAEILLLAEGYPVNFYGVESLPNEVSDQILTPIFLCTLDLARRHEELDPGVNTKVVDDLIRTHRLADRILQARPGFV